MSARDLIPWGRDNGNRTPNLFAITNVIRFCRCTAR